MAAKKKSWYAKGAAGKKRSAQEDESAKQRRDSRGPMRFWLESDSAAKITFLDTPEFFLHEHNLKLGGRWNNFFTCLKDFDTCPLDEDGDQSSYVVVGTIISHKKWTDENDVVHTNQKQLFVAKGRARQRLLKQIERREGDLKFCVYEMTRGTQATECNTGEDFEYLKKLTKKQVKMLIPDGEKEDWLEPFDYVKILAPKSPEDLRKIVGGSTPVGAEEDDDNGGGDDDNGGGDDDGKGARSIDDLL